MTDTPHTTNTFPVLAQATTHTTAVPVRTRAAHSDCERKLRVVLRANALNSIVFGALLATIPARIDGLLGTGHPGWIQVVGLALILFGACCGWLSTATPAVLRRCTPLVVAADLVWVVVSVVTVLLGWYSAGGNLAVLAMAAVVDLFALLQWSGWRRLRVIH